MHFACLVLLLGLLAIFGDVAVLARVGNVVGAGAAFDERGRGSRWQ